jgi:hypothetical protein
VYVGLLRKLGRSIGVGAGGMVRLPRTLSGSKRILPIGMLEWLSQGATAELRPTVPAGTSPEALVEVIDPVFDAARGTFRVELSLDNPDRMVPAGQRWRVRFRSSSN